MSEVFFIWLFLQGFECECSSRRAEVKVLHSCTVRGGRAVEKSPQAPDFIDLLCAYIKKNERCI